MFADARDSRWRPDMKLADRMLSRNEDLIRAIREHIVPVLGEIEIGDSLGRGYVRMEWRDANHFWDAMEAFLRLGIPVSPLCRLSGIWFRPSDLPTDGTKWGPIFAEGVLIRYAREWINMEFHRESPPLLLQDDLCCRPNSFHTTDGADLSADIRSRYPNYARECDRMDETCLDSLLGPEHELVEPKEMVDPEVDDVDARRKRTRADEDEVDEDGDVGSIPMAEELPPPPKRPAVVDLTKEPSVSIPTFVEAPMNCIICEDAVADTLVLPCEHQVCCRACSARLKNTPNAAACILCRTPVSAVLWDGE